MKRVLLAMSGGVDSSVAAYLLKKEGYDVVGATIKTWSPNACRDTHSKGCCSDRYIGDARSAALRLDIPYYVLDLSSDFKQRVIDYFIDTYLEGKTPNPCIVCNNDIKFGIFLKKAKELGADCIATGHYAKRRWDPNLSRWCLQQAEDQSKDQSYVLFGLTQEQISRTLFPLGDYHKKDIRRLARDLGLRVHDKTDSQEICFVTQRYRDIILQNRSGLPSKGRIVDREGRTLGYHNGYYLYTIGQRKGLGLSHTYPYFVLSVDQKENRVIVGKKEELFKSRMIIEKMNWILDPSLKKTYEVKIRYRSHPYKGRLVDHALHRACFEFDRPEMAVTPGQAAVLYEGPTMIGGGWIQEAFN